MAFLMLTREEKLSLQGLAARCKGIPYVYGAEVVDLSIEPEDVERIDCSELTQFLYFKIGYSLVDGARYQYVASKEIPENELDIGDLAYKRSKGVISHVAIVVSVEGKEVLICEASGTFGKVVIRPLSEFKVYPKGVEYAGVRRLIKEKIKPV